MQKIPTLYLRDPATHYVVLDEGGASVANPDPADVIALCREWGWEGTVWHHPDGRMAKLKVRDYPPRDGAA